MGKLLVAGKFDAASKLVPSRVSEILDCETITGVISALGTDKTIAFVESEIIKLAGNVNVNPALNIKDHQVRPLAEHLVENYKWESLEDFVLCFRRGSMGMYGEIYRLDGAVISQWIARYLDEKYDALEQRISKSKPDKATERATNDVAEKYIGQMLNNLKSDRKHDNSEENAFQRFKITHQTTDEYAKNRMLHLRYVRENYDPYTGKRNDKWKPEDQWLKSLGL